MNEIFIMIKALRVPLWIGHARLFEGASLQITHLISVSIWTLLKYAIWLPWQSLRDHSFWLDPWKRNIIIFPEIGYFVCSIFNFKPLISISNMDVFLISWSHYCNHYCTEMASTLYQKGSFNYKLYST